jgi:Tfp pilus assembly protein PilN
MTHLSMEALLSLREAGLEPGDASAREHLAGCAACRAELDRLHQRVARIKALPGLRPSRDRWAVVAARLRVDRRARRQRMAGLVGLAAAASIAVAVVIGPRGDVANGGEQEIRAAMARSQALETALSQYHPEQRMLDGRTAGIAQELEDRIARVDRELEMAELLEQQQPKDDQLLKLWRERVGLLDALVDVHVTRASNVGL